MSDTQHDNAIECPRCQGGRETFWYMKNLYLYDVDRARELVGDGREPIEVDEEDAMAAVDESDMDECHIAHVDPSIPGIIAYVRFRTPEGELLVGHVLIDGHHRAARCLQEERTFWAYMLTEQESADILLRRPADAYEMEEALTA